MTRIQRGIVDAIVCHVVNRGNGRQLLANTRANDRMFVGKEKDEETGLYYFGARHMQNRNARFVSVDPVGPVDGGSGKVNEKMLLNPQRLNRYAYAINNPYRYVDPDGRIPLDTIWDLANIAYDLYSGDTVSLAADTAALFIPYVPAGMTKLAKGAEKLADVAKATKWGRAETLAKHFAEHGKDFGAKSAGEYANMASDFFSKAQKERLPTKIDSDGVIRVYDAKSNTFGSYNPDGTTRTFYKPSQGQKYWERQPGVEQ